MASLLNERQHDNFSSNSKVNPRRDGIEHYKAITLISGRDLEGRRKAKEGDIEVGQLSRPEMT